MIILPPNPAELYYIKNNDTVNHTVTIDVLAENKPIYFDSFIIKPEEFLHFERPVEGFFQNRFWWLFWEEQFCTFLIDLDKVYNISHSIKLGPSMSLGITITSDNNNPIEIGWISRS